MTSYNNSNRSDLVYPELSFKIVGFSFEVFNALGSGQKEKVYQSAMEKQFQLNKILFKKELYHPLIFKDEIIGKGFFDFLVEDKIVVELKRSDNFSKSHFEQVNHYLRISNLRLGLLISFTSNGVRFKRVVNIESPSQ